MRSLFIPLLLLLALGGCMRKREVHAPRAVAVRQDGVLELSLMSFNVRYENPQDKADRSWGRRVVESVHMIRHEAPDVIGVQEVMHGQAADLWASLPEYEFFGAGRDDGKGAGEYAGIYYRKDRFEADLTDSGVFWLSDTPEIVGSMTWGNKFPRIVTWVRLMDRASGRAFYVYDTHWDHQNQYARERSALLLSRKIDERRNPLEPIVLLGDFNAIENNPAVGYMTGKKLVLAGNPAGWGSPLLDTFQSLHADQKNRRTLHFWSRSQNGSLKVDHILVSRGARIMDSAIISKTPGMVSDHFPVTAKVVFP